jgi:hypothetical protein
VVALVRWRRRHRGKYRSPRPGCSPRRRGSVLGLFERLHHKEAFKTFTFKLCYPLMTVHIPGWRFETEAREARVSS